MRRSFLIAVLLGVILSRSAFSQEGRNYQNTTAFTDVDWHSKVAFDDSYYDSNRKREYAGDRWKVVSLRAGDSWHTGTAWLMTAEIPTRGDSGNTFVALKGTYQFFIPSSGDENMIELKLAFQRQYDGRGKQDGIDWTLKTKFEPIGTQIEIPTEDDNSIPSDRLVLTITRAFHVDENGKETERRYAPSGLMDELLGTEVKRVRYLPFAYIGDSMKLTPTTDSLAKLGLDRDPPPGFQVRKVAKHTAGYRPEAGNKTNSGKSEDRKKNLQQKAIDQYNAKKYSESVATLSELIDSGSGDSWAYQVRADAYCELSKESEAIIDYRTAISLDSNNSKANNALAWIYATSKNSGVRNGKSAVTLAMKACRATDFNEYYFVDTLAAAYAETGDFRNAVQWQQKAVELAPAESKKDYQSRLDLYKAGKPHRQ